MANNNDSISLQFLICPICLCSFNDPYCLPCLHSFCKACLDKFSANKTHIDCPTCRLHIPIDSIKKDIRSAEMIDYIKNPSHSIMMNICALCREDVDSVDIHLCHDCMIGMCSNCATEHKNNGSSSTHSVCLLESKEFPLCSNHFKKLDLFCYEKNCQKEICSKCISVNHLRHDIRSIDEKIYFVKNRIIHNLDLHKKYVNGLDLLMTSLTSSFKEYDKSLDNLEDSLTAQRDKLLEIVSNCFNKEKAKVTDAKRDAHNAFQQKMAPLLLLKQKSVAVSSEAINTCQKPMSFNELCGVQDSIEFDLDLLDSDIDLEKEAFVHRISDNNNLSTISCYIKEWLGCIETEIELPFSDLSLIVNVGRPYTYSLDSQNNDITCQKENAIPFPNTNPCLIETYRVDFETVLDILYDKIHEQLIVLESSKGELLLREITKANSRMHVITKDYQEFERSCLAQLACGKILVLYFSKSRDFTNLITVSNDLEEHDRFPISLFELKKLQLICASDCRKFIFFYLTNHKIFCYDIEQNKYTCATTTFSSVPILMDVHENLDIMAFAFDNHIALFSFDDEVILKRFGSTLENDYFGICFLYENMLLASSEHSLYLFDAIEGRFDREIKRFKGKDKRICIKDPSVLAKYSSGGFWVYSENQKQIFQAKF